MNYVWLWCLQRVPEDQVEEWKATMEAPLDDGDGTAAPFTEEDEEQSFMAALAATGSA
jgi:hypothetical protein